MESRKLETQEMLARVTQFGPKHADLFPLDELPGETFAAIGAELTKISRYTSSQVSNLGSARISAAVRREARKILRNQLAPICQTAAAIAIDVPEISDKFRMPKPLRDLSLVYTGESFAKDAEPLKKQFIQHRLPEDFIEKLNAAVQGLKQAMLEQAQQTEARANARKEIETTMKTCLMLLQRIDAIVVNTLADKPAIKAEWEVTRRVVRKPSFRRKSQPQPDSKPEVTPDETPNTGATASNGAASAATA